MALRLDGRKLSRTLETLLEAEIKKAILNGYRPPGLAVIRVGEDPASAVYVSNKRKACERIGVKSFSIHLPSSSSEEDIIREIRLLNENFLVDGILLQLPLPAGIDEAPLLEAIDPLKDADGLHTLNLGKLLKAEEGPRSCTPAGVMELLAKNGISIAGKRAVVVGRSILVGKPMALLLQAANATVTVAHSKTINLSEVTKQADILVVAAGKPNFIGADHIKPGSVVVDVGIHRINENNSSSQGIKTTLCGDVRSSEVDPIVSALTPVPGGVGPMTVAMLLVNTVKSWGKHCGLSLSLSDLAT